MNVLRIRRGSAWQQQGIEEFLLRNTIPLRLACNAGRGFPSLNSLWYEYCDGSLCCATHRNSAIIGYLRADPRCAYEVAPNDPPYCGVRGQARVELQRDGAAELLSRLIGRYLGDTSPELAAWLLSRADEEYVVLPASFPNAAWTYNRGGPITRTRMVTGEKDAPLRVTQWLRWIHEATVVDVAETAEGTFVLTFETALPSDDPAVFPPLVYSNTTW